MKTIKTKIAVACVGLLLALGVGALIVYSPLGISLRQNPGSFEREHFSAVVARVRSLALPPGKEALLRLDDLSDPASLRMLEADECFERGRNAGNVWAGVAPDGLLKVVIETRDLGHAGEYGFAYSDVSLSARPFEGDWFTIDVPGRINLVLPRMKIDDHWWQVVYNLD
jgi:hypothetical protein